MEDCSVMQIIEPYISKVMHAWNPNTQQVKRIMSSVLHLAALNIQITTASP